MHRRLTRGYPSYTDTLNLVTLECLFVANTEPPMQGIWKGRKDG
uniref:Uncharacterized protein n=1 Tax=Podoviridae sp. ctoqT5 TaxID=2826577 RepID=A0A8S5MPY7_9CAUD|nr:MAG TPA: hypothetical protein [Podoviridae sp. ctoqT5]